MEDHYRKAIEEHRLNWQETNGDRNDTARPADLKLWNSLSTKRDDMGEVEQYRMKTPGTGQIDTLTFEPNADVEQALIRSLESALGNLLSYLKRKQDYENKIEESKKL
jgi:hypothetical protein